MKKMVVVCGVIKEHNQYLIAKRKSNVANGIWEFPGGKVEEKETLEEAIIRELKEELQTDVIVKEKLTVFYDEQEGYCLEIHAFLCERKQKQTVIVLHAHSEYAWVELEKLSNYEFQNADQALIHTLIEKEEKCGYK